MYQSFPLTARAPGERFDVFQSVLDTVFCPMQLDALPAVRASFKGTLEAAALGNVHLVKVATSPIAVRRRATDIARIADPAYLVKFQLRGESVWCQRGRQVRLRPGDFIIGSTAEPYSLHLPLEYEMPVLVVPRSRMRRLAPDPDQFLGMRMCGEDADCGLLSSFVGQVVARLSQLPEQMARRVEANVLDLLGGVLSARSRPGVLTGAQQLVRLKAYIVDHLREPDLRPGTIARAFGVSTRYVHALFATDQTTVCEYIRSQRVAACRRMLETAAHATASLTDVALSWGFYDLSHMTRCFRREYGATPRELMLRQAQSSVRSGTKPVR